MMTEKIRDLEHSSNEMNSRGEAVTEDTKKTGPKEDLSLHTGGVCFALGSKPYQTPELRKNVQGWRSKEHVTYRGVKAGRYQVSHLHTEATVRALRKMAMPKHNTCHLSGKKDNRYLGNVPPTYVLQENT